MKNVLLTLPLLFLCLACDKINALVNLPSTLDSMNSTMNKMSSNTSEMNGGMKTTNNGIHNQTLKLAMDGLMDRSNWDELFPVPFKLLPFGKAFAEEASAEELMLYFDATILELSTTKTESAVDLQSGDGTPYTSGSQDLKNAILEKTARTLILGIIASFVPQDLRKDPNHPMKDTLGEIISKEIQFNGGGKGGRFQSAALALLAFRFNFMNGVLLNSWEYQNPMSNLGYVEDVVYYAERIDFICQMPQAEKISVYLKIAFDVIDSDSKKPVPTNLDFSTTVDRSQALVNWKNIRNGIDHDLKVGQASVGQDPGQESQNLAYQQQQLNDINSLVNNRIFYWEKQKH